MLLLNFHKLQNFVANTEILLGATCLKEHWGGSIIMRSFLHFFLQLIFNKWKLDVRFRRKHASMCISTLKLSWGETDLQGLSGGRKLLRQSTSCYF